MYKQSRGLWNGCKVTFRGANEQQVKYGGGDDPRDILTIGAVYKVIWHDSTNFMPSLKLEGINGRFNSFLFNLILENNPSKSIAA